MATMRELFHSLGNKHNAVTVGCGATAEIVQECLGQERSKALKDKLSEIKKNLAQIIGDALEADKIAAQIRDRLSQGLEPDTGKKRDK